MEVAKDSLEFLDLKLMFDKESKKVSVDVFSKAKQVQLPLRRICDSDKKFEKRRISKLLHC